MRKLPALTREEVGHLDAALRAVADRTGRPVSFNALLKRWQELVHEVTVGYSLTLYDYTNDLSVRDQIEEVLTRVPDSLRARLEEVVRPLDERFEEGTTALEKPLLPRSHRWWFRIPRKRSAEFDADI
jgi:hypothetical protein